MLGDAEAKLREALAKIDSLDKTMKQRQSEHEAEARRLNTEIERLNSILKATNGNMQDQVTKLSEQIS